MAETPENSPIKILVDDLVLNVGSRTVTRNGADLDVGGLTFDLLLTLVGAAPAMASYDFLVDKVWNGRETSPGTIAQRAKMLRDALSDDAAEPRYFELIRGQGYRLVADVKPVAEGRASSRSSRVVLAALAVVLLAAGFLVANYVGDAERSARSIAVLPFEDLSSNGDYQHLADGIAKELVHELAGLSGLSVASRPASLTASSETDQLQAIGDRLEVDTVVSGSVLKSGDSLKVLVEAVDVGGGTQLWSEVFNSSVANIIHEQESIAESVVGAVGIKLGVGGVNDFRGAGTDSFEAYEAYIQRDYEKAINLDPEYAAAWSRQGLRIAESVWGKLPETAPALFEQAFEHVIRARELEPMSAQAHAYFAAVSQLATRWNAAEEAYAQALAISRRPDFVTSYGNMMTRVGRIRVAEGFFEEADQLLGKHSGGKSAAPMHRMNVHIALKQVDAAHVQAERLHPEARKFSRLTIALNFGTADDVRTAIEALPQGTPDYAMLYEPLLEFWGSPAEARTFLLELAADSSRKWPYKYETIATWLAYLGDPDSAFEVFLQELTFTSVRYGSLWFPVLSDVRQLPAFKDFAQSVGLVDYWNSYGWPGFCRPVDEMEFVCD